jgi:hypothetical protein
MPWLGLRTWRRRADRPRVAHLFDPTELGQSLVHTRSRELIDGRQDGSVGIRPLVGDREKHVDGTHRRRVGDPLDRLGHNAPGKHAGDPRDLHGRDGDVAHDRGGDAEPDRELTGSRQRGCGCADPTSPEAILHDPELVQTLGLNEAGERPQPRRRDMASERHTDV